jgi:predicted Zn-dependent peptidase
MIALIAALAIEASNFEVVDGSRKDAIQVEALVQLPSFGPHERAALQLLSETLLADTADYGHADLLDRTAPTGDPIGVDLLPDAVRVHFSLGVQDASALLPMLESILHGATLSDDAINAAKAEDAFRESSVWDSALDPIMPDVKGVRPEDVRVLYRRLFSPQRMTIAVAAPNSLQTGDLAGNWAERTAAWPKPKLPLRLVDPGHVPVRTERRGHLTTVQLRGQNLEPTQFGPAALAAFALGSGKGATLFTKVREGLGWTYRQECPLRGTPNGFELDVTVVTARSDADFDHANALKPALLSAIDAWTEQDRTRALAAARTLLERGVGMNPLYDLGTKSTLDPLFLRAYGRIKLGEPLDAKALLRKLMDVDLATMKATAKAEVEGAGLEIIRGKD